MLILLACYLAKTAQNILHAQEQAHARKEMGSPLL